MLARLQNYKEKYPPITKPRRTMVMVQQIKNLFNNNSNNNTILLDLNIWIIWLDPVIKEQAKKGYHPDLLYQI